jgi:hypothetical protein
MILGLRAREDSRYNPGRSNQMFRSGCMTFHCMAVCDTAIRCKLMVGKRLATSGTQAESVRECASATSE